MLRKIFASSLATLILLFSSMPALAQTAGQGLEISPPLVEINANPGQVVTFDLRLRNITKGTLVATPEINDFVAQGEDGQPKLLLGQTSGENDPYSVKGWVSALNSFTIVPQEIKTSKITLSVPKDASPGGHYGVVRFTAVAPELKDTGVALSASIGSLILVKVSGNVVEKGKIQEFYVTHNGVRGSMFEGGTVGFVERIKNEGNVHFKPVGTVRVTNAFGKQVGVVTVNAAGGNVLPNSTRKFSQDLGKKRLFGLYHAEVNIQYNGKNLSDTTSFWVIPYRMIAIAIGILLLLFVLIRKGLKFYANRAVNRAMSGQAGAPKSDKDHGQSKKKK